MSSRMPVACLFCWSKTPTVLAKWQKRYQRRASKLLECASVGTGFRKVLQRLCEATPIQRISLAIHRGKPPKGPMSPIDRAHGGFFVRCRQSLAGRMKSFATLSRTRTRRGMNEQASAWLTAIEGLPAVRYARLSRVAILNHSPLWTLSVSKMVQTRCSTSIRLTLERPGQLKRFTSTKWASKNMAIY